MRGYYNSLRETPKKTNSTIENIAITWGLLGDVSGVTTPPRRVQRTLSTLVLGFSRVQAGGGLASGVWRFPTRRASPSARTSPTSSEEYHNYLGTFVTVAEESAAREFAFGESSVTEIPVNGTRAMMPGIHNKTRWKQ